MHINKPIISKVKTKRGEPLYLFCYVVFIIVALFSTTFYYQYYAPAYNYICYALVLMTISNEVVYGKIILRSVAFIVSLAVLFVVIIGTSERHTMINLISLGVFLYCGREFRFERIAKITIILDLLFLIFVITTSKIGIIPNHTFIIWGRMREGLGFLYALYPPTILGNIILLEMYLVEGNLSWKKICIYLLEAYWLYEKTDARLMAFVSGICLLISIVTKISKGRIINKPLLQVLICLSCPFCAFISLFLSFDYGNRWWHLPLNELLNGRLSLAHSAINKYGISIVGQKIEWIGAGLGAHGNQSTVAYNYVDNLYVQLLVQYGIVAFCLLVIGYITLQIILCRRGEFFLALVMTILAFHGLIDDLVLYLHFNTFWIVFGQIVSAQNRYAMSKSGSRRKYIIKHTYIYRE